MTMSQDTEKTLAEIRAILVTGDSSVAGSIKSSLQKIADAIDQVITKMPIPVQQAAMARSIAESLRSQSRDVAEKTDDAARQVLVDSPRLRAGTVKEIRARQEDLRSKLEGVKNAFDHGFKLGYQPGSELEKAKDKVNDAQREINNAQTTQGRKPS